MMGLISDIRAYYFLLISDDPKGISNNEMSKTLRNISYLKK